MPDQPSWYRLVPEIIAALERTRAPVLDRFAIEQLFHVRRRQAIRILRRFGGYQAGRCYLIEPARLLEHLRALGAQAAVDTAVRRRERLWRVLRREQEALQARGVKVASLPCSDVGACLPPGVDFQPGMLTITYSKPVQLLEKLYALIRTMARDYEGFQRRYTPPT